MTTLPVTGNTGSSQGEIDAGVAAPLGASATSTPIFLAPSARGTPDATAAAAVARTASATSTVGDAFSPSPVDPVLQRTELNNDTGGQHVAHSGDDGGSSIAPSVAGARVVLGQDAGASAADAALEAPEDSRSSGQEGIFVERETAGISPPVPAGARCPVFASATSSGARTGAEPQPYQQRRKRRRQQLGVVEEEEEDSNRSYSYEWTGTSAHDDDVVMPSSGVDGVEGNNDIIANHGNHDRARPLSMVPMASSQSGAPQRRPLPPPLPPETTRSGSASQSDAQSQATKHVPSSAHTPKCDTASKATAADGTSTVDRAVKTDTVKAIAAAAAAASISPRAPSRASEDKGWVVGAGEVLVGVAGGATDAVLGTVTDVAGGLLGVAGDATGGAVGILLGTLSWWGGGGGDGGGENGRVKKAEGEKKAESEKEAGKYVKGDEVDPVPAPPSELPQREETAGGEGRAAGDEGKVRARRGRGEVGNSSTEDRSSVGEGCRRDDLPSDGWSAPTYSRVPPQEVSTADAGGGRSSDSGAKADSAGHGARTRRLDRAAAKEGLASPASDDECAGCDDVAVEGANGRRDGGSSDESAAVPDGDKSKSDSAVVVLPGEERSDGGESTFARNGSADDADEESVFVKDRKIPVKNNGRVTIAVESERIVRGDQNKDASVGGDTTAVAAGVGECNGHSGQVETIVENGNESKKHASAALIARAEASGVGGDSGDGDRGDALGRGQENGNEGEKKPTPESAGSTSKPGLYLFWCLFVAKCCRGHIYRVL